MKVTQWTMWMLAAALAGAVPLARAQDAQTNAPAAPERAAVPVELTDPKYLFEIVRHLYRWQLDEGDVDRLSGTQDFQFWVRMLDVTLDEEDRSQLAEIVLPQLGILAKVKRPDYHIEEMGMAVTSRVFRIVNVSKLGIPEAPSPAHQVVTVSYPEMREYLFRTRAESAFPDGALLERLRVAVRKQMGLDPQGHLPGRQIAHLAPLSPVANDAWVFVENLKLLVRFSSDIDLTNPAVWEHETLLVKTWDVQNQVVASLDEAAGSNAFLTRDQIGRALYNCVVLGQRLEMHNPDATAAP